MGGKKLSWLVLAGIASIVAGPILVVSISFPVCVGIGYGGVCTNGHPFWLLLLLPIGLVMLWLGSRPSKANKEPDAA